MDDASRVLRAGRQDLSTEGDYISLDGSTGKIYGEAIPTVDASISGDFGRLMAWADEAQHSCRYAPTPTPRADAAQAREPLARRASACAAPSTCSLRATRIKAMREMILSKTEEQRRVALDKLLPMQQGDFEAIYEAMQGLPVTIRFLDPPLHEFVPHTEEGHQRALPRTWHMSVEEIHNVIDSLHEFNPMMGHRGCRLAVSYPEIAEMQTTRCHPCSHQRQAASILIGTSFRKS